MPVRSPLTPGFSLGIAGSGPFSIAARKSLDAYIAYNYQLFADHRPLRVVIAVETSFERRAAERVAALRGMFPELTLTVLVFPELPGQGVSALADEVCIGDDLAEKPRFLADLSDEVIDCYRLCQRSRSRELRRFAGGRVLRLQGRKVVTALGCMGRLARFADRYKWLI